MDVMRALRHKYRYTCPKGMVNTEDLWDLPLTAPNGAPNVANLNDIAIGINSELAKTGVTGFVPEVDTQYNRRAKILTNQLEIVKAVIAVKVKEREAAQKAVATRQRNNRIREIIAAKQDQTLQDMPVEKLQELLEDE